MSGPVQLPLGIGLPDSARFETFHPGPNDAVLHALHAASRGTGERVIWLTGPAGSGKTHLVQACCTAAGGAGLRAALLPLGTHADLEPAVVEGWEHYDLVCIDDFDAVAGRAEWEHALFALFNAVAASGGRWIAAGADVPSGIGCRLPDLVSRLAAGPVYVLRPLDDAGRLAALRLRARSRGFDLPDDAGRYLLRRAPRDMNSLYALLERLDSVTMQKQRRVTIPLLRELLE